MKKILNKVFSQKFIVISLLLVQVLFIGYTVTRLGEQYMYMHYVFATIGFVLTLYIVNRPGNPAYKLAWIIPLLLMPMFTAIVYFFIRDQFGTRYVKNLHRKKCANTRPFLQQNKRVMENLEADSRNVANLAKYIDHFGGYPVYQNTFVEYFKVGEEKYEAMLRELKKAKHFIFMEYFIIAEGEMWNTIEQILIEKARDGVDVRILYDGMGTQAELPFHYDKKISKTGIRCKVFNPFRPMLSSIQNNRDHRKILVIDGITAFNGGINIADEYINKKERFGHWKDTAVMLKGEAVWNFTMMFLQMWEITDFNSISEYDKYRPTMYMTKVFRSDGFIAPFGDSPLDNENVSELVYMNIINNARDYVYITTPYLILDNEMVTALGYAAKSGVDVRIIVPGIPDKWYIKLIGQSFYKQLIQLGVKIYEYDIGFIHAKNFVSDDTTAVVGTVNLDYRSLYLHFECATYMYKTQCVADIKADFENILESNCHEVTYEECDKRSIFKKIFSAILGMFAPLL